MNQLNQDKVQPSLLVLCQLFYPELVSTGQTLTELCTELARLGWNIEVVCAAPTIVKSAAPVPSDMVYENVKIHRVWATRFPKLSLAGRVINQLTYSISTILFLIFRSNDRPILVLTNPPFLPFACLVARVFRPKLRFTLLVFDVYPDTAIHLGMLAKHGWTAKIWEKLNILSFRAAKKVIVIGRCMRDVILAKGQRAGLDLTSKLEFIHIWADDQMIQDSEPQLPTVFRGRDLEDKFIVLYSGNMGRFHDVETILEAAVRLKDHPQIRFAFIGEGAKKKSVLDAIERHSLTNCIVDTYVPKEELGCLLRSAHVGMATLMLGQEGLSVPSKTLGLMAAGVPVTAIMSANSEIALLAEEAGFGVVIPPGDVEKLVQTLEGLFAKPELCHAMGKAGAAIVKERLSLRKAAEAYSRVLGIV
jgi:glycosyltransferase involved in cell wall biosynthesis